MTAAEVAERLDRLEGAEAARVAMARYGDAVDAVDLDALGEVFAPDATLEIAGRTCTGREEVLGFYREVFATDPTVKSHFVTNIATEWLGAGRTAVRARFLYTASGDDTSILGWGRYEATVGGGPRIERLAIDIRRSEDVRTGWAGPAS